jgi:hypothetical protein
LATPLDAVSLPGVHERDVRWGMVDRHISGSKTARSVRAGRGNHIARMTRALARFHRPRLG